ncbi:MAG: trimeric intracellular cation channel family protein [Bacteroidaceae bacterium]|nr:trimeric intracellular cation channel family protein [Bacteroidaceae bacterium]
MELINAIFNWFSTITFLQIIDFIGTFAFAISVIRLASAKQFDWFGAYVVGAATAIGGGTLRDVMLDVPVFWMHDGFYLSCTGLALLWVILFRKYLVHMHNTFFVFDAVGLALFTIVGIQKTLDCNLPIWVAIVMGTMTGAAGGVIRDVLINEVPLIFRKEIYAMACIVGGVVFGICSWLGMPNPITQVACGVAVFLTRLFAVKHHICLPTLKAEDEPEKQ